jgi:hypothetical protein
MNMALESPYWGGGETQAAEAIGGELQAAEMNGAARSEANAGRVVDVANEREFR